MAERSCVIPDEVPMRFSTWPTLRRSSSFSRFRRAASMARMARLTSGISRSDLNGFSMKSYAPRRMASIADSMVPCPLIMMTRQVRVGLLDDVEDLQAPVVPASKPDIKDDQPWGTAPDLVECLRIPGRLPDVEPLILENAGKHEADIRLVIDNKNVCGHLDLPVRLRSMFPRRIGPVHPYGKLE